MTKLEEKIQLAKEMGFDMWANQRVRELMNSKEIARLTSLNFKQITFSEIDKKIRTLHLSGWGEFDHPAFIFPIVLGAIIGSAILGESGCFKWGVALLVYGLSLLAALIYVVPKPRFSKLGGMKLDEWKDNMPYGALLALKEAKEAGLGNFRIFYPVKFDAWRNQQRLKADPVIVGSISMDGPMYEVFAWDDGKVYD